MHEKLWQIVRRLNTDVSFREACVTPASLSC
jgi:hypothetical protein